MRFWDKSLRIFNYICDHGRQGIRRIAQQTGFSQTHLKRDSWVSVMYAEELNSAKSSVTRQRTDRHEILGQKPSHLQVSL